MSATRKVIGCLEWIYLFCPIYMRASFTLYGRSRGDSVCSFHCPTGKVAVVWKGPGDSTSPARGLGRES